MTQLIDTFVDQHADYSSEAAWLSSARIKGIEQFNQLGIPSLKHEDWKYTNLRVLANKRYSIARTDAAIDLGLLSDTHDTHRLVFCNGDFKPELSDSTDFHDGVTLLSMSEAISSQAEELKTALSEGGVSQSGAFAALNMGLFRDGAFVKIAADCKLEKPIELVFISGGEKSLSLPRNYVVLEKGAKAHIIERHLSDGGSSPLCNSACDIHLADHAVLDYNLVQLQGRKSTHIGVTKIHQAASSELSMHTISLGGQLIRNDLRVIINGEDAQTNCTGLYYGHQRQHMDNHTTIVHAAPNSVSRELYKGILDDRARGVFHGRVKVEQIAQLTESEQENPNLLLSRDAEVDTKPQLEIYADDVKCAHGATVGELDLKQLFYLQSRGIDRATAKTLLTYAFAAEVIEEIEIDSLREELTALVAAKMRLGEQ